jgi:hypothetical protein
MKTYTLFLAFILASTALGEDLKLTLTVRPSDQTYADRRTIDFDLQNLTQRDIDVTSATLTLPAWYGVRPRPLEFVLTDLEGDLNPTDVSTARIELVALDTRQAIKAIFTEPPLFVYKQLHGTVDIRYQFTGEHAEQPVFRQEFDLPAQSPIWHVLAGGIVGLLLAYLIAMIVSRLPMHPVRSFFAALIVVPLTIFIARLSTGLLPLPVTVDLRDSVGGLIVGVFAFWLVPKVVARLIPENKGGATPDTPAVTPEDPGGSGAGELQPSPEADEGARTS